MTPKQRKIAAGIIEARKFTLDNDTDPDTLAAAAFVFDQGIFFLPDSAKQEVIAMLRAPSNETSSTDRGGAGK